MERTISEEVTRINQEQRVLIKITELLAEENLLSPWEKARMLQEIRKDEGQ